MFAMLCLLLLAAVLIEHANGRPALPPLPVKGDTSAQALKGRPVQGWKLKNSRVFLPTDGCFVASSEVELFRVEGEAVILSFPMFSRVLQVRKIAPSSAKYTISKGNGSKPAADEDEGRLLQNNKQLWFLPAKASDSGEYTCTYRCAWKPPRHLLWRQQQRNMPLGWSFLQFVSRNETYCVTGSIQLHVYEPLAADMEKLSFPIRATVGEKLTFKCPSISNFNSTQRLIEWSKVRGSTCQHQLRHTQKASPRLGSLLPWFLPWQDSASNKLQPETGGSFQWHNGHLLIPAVEQAHAGIYTCQLNILINNQQFKVSRAILLHVEGGHDDSFNMVCDLIQG